MTIHIETMPEFDSAAGEDAYEYLYANAPRYEKATRIQVDKGRSPEQIYNYVLKLIGDHRDPLAMRCKLYAMYLISTNGGGES